MQIVATRSTCRHFARSLPRTTDVRALSPRRRSRLGCFRSLRKTKQPRDLTLFACSEAVEEHANIAFVDPAREEWSKAHEARAGRIEDHEMVERDERAAT